MPFFRGLNIAICLLGQYVYSLMALRLAGKQPSIVQDVTGNAMFESVLTQRLAEMGGDVSIDFYLSSGASENHR
jgi:hypothetical protein